MNQLSTIKRQVKRKAHVIIGSDATHLSEFYNHHRRRRSFVIEVEYKEGVSVDM